MNDGDIPAERYDFLEQDIFKGHFDLTTYCKIDIYDFLLSLINQIKEEQFNLGSINLGYSNFGFVYISNVFSWN